MKTNKNLLSLLVLGISLLCVNLTAQEDPYLRARPMLNYVFSADSLQGFDEQQVTKAAVAEGFTGIELRTKLFREKRNFVNSKYNIQPVYRKQNYFNPAAAQVVAPACTNEDFEASPAGAITGQNQINGWTITGDVNTNYPNNCNLDLCCGGNPYQGAIVDCPAATGFVDPVIGGSYPIYSVFGNGNNNGNGSNPQVPFQMGGTKVIRINNAQSNYSVEKLSKTFAVTANNALFQFAFISVFYTSHGCCDGANLTIKLTNNGTVVPCPQFSIAAPSNQCTTVTPVSYFNAGTGTPFTGSGTYIFNKWGISSLDLTQYIGQNITINITVSDCIYGGHYGYAYFDAQCSPMTIIGNGTAFPAGTQSITLPTCGANGATIVAPGGLGPYSWSSNTFVIPAGYTQPSYTNQIIVLPNITGTVMLTMNPPGSCAPIQKVITVSVTPAPQVVATATQPGCTNTLSAASITTAGSASVNPTITWSPSPQSVAGNSMSASGLVTGITTITVVDPLGCQATATLNILPAPPQPTFAVNNLTGSYTITCLNPVINLQAVSGYTYGTLNYSWTSISFTANTSTVAISQPNTMTVTAYDAATNCFTTEVLSIGINTTAPTSTLNPLQQAITCNSASPVTFTSTITSPTLNIEHQWFNPLNPGVPQTTAQGTTSILGPPFNPGVYTVCAVNMVNGCRTCRNFTVTSLSAFPSFSMSSSTNFSVGCAPNKNTTTITIVNPVSTQTPPATTSWTFLPPGFAGVVSPSVILNTTNNSTVTTTPGTWTVIVQDNSNFCRAELSIPITQNTVGPHVMASMATQTLLCNTPTILATGSSSTANTTIEWNVALPPPNNLPSSTLVIGTPSVGPQTSSTSLTYANYTVIATNTVNGCTSTSIVTISQNFRPPVSDPKISVATPTAIYCNAGLDPVRLTTGNSTVTSGMQNAFVSPLLWQGPPPQYTATGVSTYSAFIPGIYSLTVIDSQNGCTKTNTVEVLDRTQPPVLATPITSVPLNCGTNSATIQFVLTGTTLGGTKNLVTEAPPNTQFSPPAANDNISGGTASQTVLVNQLGKYEYLVTNTLTGCQAFGTVFVVPGTLDVGFTANPSTGFAPLAVAFSNTTAATGGGAFNSIWSFGNGSTASGTTATNGSAVYTAPGTYTVMLIAQKGDCLDTAYQVIKVDIPSKLEVPNVFTPNKDGSNDLFFLKVANVSSISAVIVDRWGNKVYEVESNTGNISWDGTNLSGKECPAGTYFYIIKATGKDDTIYEKKGHVSLYR